MVRMGGQQLSAAALKAARELIGASGEEGAVDTPFGSETDDAIPSYDWREHANEHLQHREQLLADAESKKPIRVLLNKLNYISDVISECCDYLVSDVWPHMQFDVCLGDPVFSTGAFIMFMFMFFKKMSPEVIYLAICFQFCINPLYVVLVALGLKAYLHQSRTPRMYTPLRARPALQRPEAYRAQTPPLAPPPGPSPGPGAGAELGSLCEALNGAAYDHILVGGDLSTLYAAALLARCGHACLVLRVRAGTQMKVG
jgi:hypothetical protein